MNEQDIQHFKKKLEEEKAMLTTELSSMGRQINESGDWMATAEKEDDGFHADNNENADAVEDFEANVASLTVLEQQYSAVTAGLKRIEEGTYGICKVSGEPIEFERLEANPSADTCIAHME